MSNCAVTVLNNELEYKPTLRNSITAVFQAIQYEVISVIDFLGYSKNDYIITSYPLTIQRKDGGPIPEVLLGCIKSKLSGVSDTSVLS